MNRLCQYGPFLVVVLNSAVITYWIHFIHDFCVSGSTCYVPAIVLSTVTFFSALSSNSPMRNISLALFYPRRNWDSVRTDEFLIHKDVKWQGQNLKLAPKAMLSSLLWDKPSLHLFRHFQVLQWVCRSCVLLSFEKLLPVNYIQHTPKKNLLQLLLQNSASSYYINFPPWTWHQISDIMGGGGQEEHTIHSPCFGLKKLHNSLFRHHPNSSGYGFWLFVKWMTFSIRNMVASPDIINGFSSL